MEKSYICRFLLRYDIFWSFKTICPLLYIVYVLYILCAIYYIAWFPDIDVPILDYFKCRIGLKSNDDNFSFMIMKDNFYQNATGTAFSQLNVTNPWHYTLCNKSSADKKKWSNCLPISGRMDTPYCRSANVVNLFQVQSPGSLCYASVLHLLLVDVFYLMKEQDYQPALIYGTLLGAIRNQQIIPFTQDVDMGYQGGINKTLVRTLSRRGYHMFQEGLWRICVAPDHPLAPILYDSKSPAQRRFMVPYVDLYLITKTSPGFFRLQQDPFGAPPRKGLIPYMKVNVSNIEFDTLANPISFLNNAYGVDYMTEKDTNRIGIGRQKYR